MTPLILYVYGPWVDHPAIQALRAKGHDVRALALDPGPDLILHPRAHWWHETFWTKPAYLDAALKAVRKRRREAA